MLDKDLATLYGVETRTLNQAVKRNIQRFPTDFRFQLTMEECSKSQIVTLNAGRGQNIKKLSYAFTEQGVAMLSSVLRSQTAIDVNIQIMRAFVSMRHFMLNNASVFSRLETIEYHQLEMQQHQQETDKRIDEVFADWTRVIFVIYLRPRVARPSAASSITFGREQHERRPQIDNL